MRGSIEEVPVDLMWQIHPTRLAAAACFAVQLSHTYCGCGLSSEAIDSLLCSNPAQPSNTSMASHFSLSTALEMLDIPMPEDDNMSEDEFDGYLDDYAGDDNVDGNIDGAVDDSINDDSEADLSIPDFEQLFGCSQDTTDASPLHFFFNRWLLMKCSSMLLNRPTCMHSSTWRTQTCLLTPELMVGNEHLMIWLS